MGENRSTTFHGVRLNAEDRAVIEAAATATGQTLPSYMRAAALEKADPTVYHPPYRRRLSDPLPANLAEAILQLLRRRKDQDRLWDEVVRIARRDLGLSEVEPRPKGGR